MNRLSHHFAAALAAVLVLLCTSAAWAAQSPPDPERTGGIHLTLLHGPQPVAGTISLWQAARLELTDGTWQYVLTEDFAPSHIPLGDLSGAELAEKLSAWVDHAQLPAVLSSADSHGVVRFDTLPLGVYLLRQDTAEPGYLPLAPFLVSVPCEKDGAWIYTVEALPKTSPQVNSDDFLPPPDSITPDKPSPDDTPTLPQTGQLNWPVPVLTIGGLVLFAVGWSLCRRKERDRDAL